MTQTLSHFGVGASEISAVAGMNPYASPWDVFCRKTGETPDSPMTEPMEWGHRLEPAIRQKYVDDTKEAVYVPDTSLFHPEIAWARATPDGIALHGPENAGSVHTTWKHLLQCKNVSQWVGKAWEVAPPDYVQLQEQWEMYVTGLSRADVAVLIGGSEFRIYTVHRDDKMIADLVAIASAFWRRVETRTPPPIDESPACKEHFERRLRKAAPVELVANDEVDEMFATWRQLNSEAKRIEKRVNEIRNHVRAHLADAQASRLVTNFGTASLLKSEPKTKTDTNWRLVAELLGTKAPDEFKELVSANTTTTVTDEKVTLYAPREWQKDIA